MEALLADAPGLEAKTLFEVSIEKSQGRFDEGQLRTLQRRVRTWRAERGPDAVPTGMSCSRSTTSPAKPRKRASVTELAVTITGEAFVHMLCVFVCSSGACPTWKSHQTEDSTDATHRIPNGRNIVVEGERARLAESKVTSADSVKALLAATTTIDVAATAALAPLPVRRARRLAAPSWLGKSARCCRALRRSGSASR